MMFSHNVLMEGIDAIDVVSYCGKLMLMAVATVLFCTFNCLVLNVYPLLLWEPFLSSVVLLDLNIRGGG